MDTAGKDGAIEHVMGAFNPQGVQITAFKVPTSEELAHDYLWRIHKAAPPRGMVGIFNRSHYEDVLVVRVAKLAPKKVWGKRFDHINDFEKMLSDSGVRIVKLFLHISAEEQAERLTERRDTPEKQWKFNPGDLKTRTQWSQYSAPTRTSWRAARRRGRRGSWCRPTASGTATWWSPRCSWTPSRAWTSSSRPPSRTSRASRSRRRGEPPPTRGTGDSELARVC